MMEMYKKKSLKFTHEQFSRDFRHAEALKARDSSRFERLSIIRSINDSDFVEENSIVKEAMEQVSQNSIEVPEVEQTKNTDISSKKSEKPSRLELMYKWKQEKLMKKQLEMKNKKKPFYAGSSASIVPLTNNFSADKSSQNMKSSFINRSTTSSNSSKIAKNRIVAPTALFQPSRIPNNSKMPNSFSKSASHLAKGPTPVFVKKPVQATENSSTVMSKKQLGLDSNSSMANVASKVVSSKITPSSRSKLQKPNERSATKTATSQAGSASRLRNVVNSVMSSRITPSSSGSKGSKTSGSCLTKTANQGLPATKLMFSRLPNKTIPKVGAAAAKPVSGIPSTFSKGIPKPQAQIPNSNIKKLNTVKVPNKPASKENLKTEQKDYVTMRKGYCFKKAVAASKSTQAVIKNVAGSKPEEKAEKKVEAECSKKESYSEKIQNNISEVTFNCDVSIIPSSFAPPNFKFQPPNNLWNDMFEEDGDDIQDIIEQARKFMSRTSTPSKEICERSSSICFKDFSLAKDPPPVQIQNTCENLVDESECNSIKVINENPRVMLNGEEIDTETPDILLNESLDGVQENKVNNGHVDINSPETLLDNKSPQRVQHEEWNHKSKTCSVTDKIPEDILIESQKIDSEIPDMLVNKSFEIKNKSLSNQSVQETTLNQSLKKETETNLVFKTTSSDEKPADVNNENGEMKAPSEPQSGVCIENEISDTMNNKVPDEKSPKSEACKWSPLGTPVLDDLKKMAQAQIDLINLEEEDLDLSNNFEELVSIKNKKKSTGTIPKRVSILKSVSVLNSIVETSEADESNIKSPMKTPKKTKTVAFTPRRSMRTSSCPSPAFQTNNYDDLPNIEEPPLITITPRRSMRLKSLEAGIKSSEGKNSDNLSPFKTRKSIFQNFRTPRRSMRLVSLNSESPIVEDSVLITPVKYEDNKTNLTADFARLHLKSEIENINPENLIDFDSPGPLTRFGSKKISLLYSPEKRKSMRRSIKGDLMTFSPSGK